MKESSLWQLVRKGSEAQQLQAENDLAKLYNNVFFKACVCATKRVRRISGLSHLDLEDVLDFAFIAFTKAIRKYNPNDPSKASFRTYLITAVNREATHVLRGRKGWEKFHNQQITEKIVYNNLKFFSYVDVDLGQNEDWDCLWAAVCSKLTQRERTFISLHIMYNWSITEIGRMFQIAKQTALNLYNEVIYKCSDVITRWRNHENLDLDVTINNLEEVKMPSHCCCASETYYMEVNNICKDKIFDRGVCKRHHNLGIFSRK